MILADVPEHFRGTVSIWAMVTSTDGSQQVAFDDSTPVQRQLVDVRYSKDTRKQFKPGLSYVGKVSPGRGAQQGLSRSQALRCLPAQLLPKDHCVITAVHAVGPTAVTWLKTTSFDCASRTFALLGSRDCFAECDESWYPGQGTLDILLHLKAWFTLIHIVRCSHT